MKTYKFAVAGMHCASCGMTIDDAVEEVPGVHTAATDFRKELTTVECDDALDQQSVIDAIHDAGYQALPKVE